MVRGCMSTSRMQGVSVWELNPRSAGNMNRVTFRVMSIPMHVGLVHCKKANVKDLLCPA